jgi:intergrase/recombinase
LINNTQSSRKIVSKFLNYLKDEGFSQENIDSCKKLLKKDINFSNDTYVPTDQEIKVTLSKLREDLKPLYLLFLFSGIRVSEGIYLLNNLNNLKIQCKDNYCKIHLDYNRHNKRSFFCYIPYFIYTQIGVQKTELNNIRIFIKRNKLIPLKYCRKWFYTKCIELGIPESIADFYEGRVATSVGSINIKYPEKPIRKLIYLNLNTSNKIKYILDTYNKYNKISNKMIILYLIVLNIKYLNLILE